MTVSPFRSLEFNVFPVLCPPDHGCGVALWRDALQHRGGAGGGVQVGGGQAEIVAEVWNVDIILTSTSFLIKIAFFYTVNDQSSKVEIELISAEKFLWRNMNLVSANTK